MAMAASNSAFEQSYPSLSPEVAKTILCRYHSQGQCVYGQGCFFSHDRGLDKVLQAGLCEFYLKGNCRYGHRCRFDHVKPSRLNAASITTSFSSPHTSATTDATAAPGVSEDPTTSRLHQPRESSEPPVATHNENIAVESSDSSEVTPTSPNQQLSPPRAKQRQLVDYNSDVSDKMLEMAIGDTSWADAPVFVPGQPFGSPVVPFSYSAVAKSCLEETQEPHEYVYDDTCGSGYYVYGPTTCTGVTEDTTHEPVVANPEEICPLHLTEECSYDAATCIYTHGDKCHICGLNCLHPTDKQSRVTHEQECFKDHAEDIEESFRISRSQSKQCGICMETIYDKQPPSRRKFGILSHCNHVFCLDCLREWRCQKTFENNVKRSCPECRVMSHFVTPSPYWVEDAEEKQQLIDNYKNTLNTKDCKYFEGGAGVCPFGPNCFYRHALPNGAIAPKTAPRYQTNAGGESRMMSAVRLFEFLLERENRDQLLSDLDIENEDDFLFILLQAFMTTDSDDDSDIE